MTNNKAGQPGVTAVKVGVVIPTYNRVGYLREAVASILEQEYGNLNILVVDDFSSDDTAAYLAGLDDPRLSFVVNKRNLGLAGSINLGVRQLPADIGWCTVLCDDDRLEKDYLANIVRAVGERDIRSVVYGRIRFIDKHGAIIRDVPLPPLEETSLGYLRSRADASRETYLSGALFRREAFERLGGYPQFTTGMAADEALLFALALQDRLVYVPEAWVCIRVHGEAESQQVWGIPGHLEAVREYAGYCKRLAAETVAADQQFSVELAEVLQRRVRILNSLLWLRGERFLRKYGGRSERARQELATLYAMACCAEWIFPGRIRVDGWCARLSGMSPEGFGLYRYFWEKVLGITPGR